MLARREESVDVSGKGVEVMHVWKVNVSEVTVRCVFPTREGEECSAWGVGRGVVGASDGVFHSSAHAFVVVFRVCNVGAVLCVFGIDADGT
jgi:hypothetical protein